jgi:hypothetical protein
VQWDRAAPREDPWPRRGERAAETLHPCGIKLPRCLLRALASIARPALINLPPPFLPQEDDDDEVVCPLADVLQRHGGAGAGGSEDEEDDEWCAALAAIAGGIVSVSRLTQAGDEAGSGGAEGSSGDGGSGGGGSGGGGSGPGGGGPGEEVAMPPPQLAGGGVAAAGGLEAGSDAAASAPDAVLDGGAAAGAANAPPLPPPLPALHLPIGRAQRQHDEDLAAAAPPPDACPGSAPAGDAPPRPPAFRRAAASLLQLPSGRLIPMCSLLDKIIRQRNGGSDLEPAASGQLAWGPDELLGDAPEQSPTSAPGGGGGGGGSGNGAAPPRPWPPAAASAAASASGASGAGSFAGALQGPVVVPSPHNMGCIVVRRKFAPRAPGARPAHKRWVCAALLQGGGQGARRGWREQRRLERAPASQQTLCPAPTRQVNHTVSARRRRRCAPRAPEAAGQPPSTANA